VLDLDEAQVENARRFDVDLDRWPLIRAIDAAWSRIEAFRRAAPALQPDAV
jgi:maleylpyruvate isomerase